LRNLSIPLSAEFIAAVSLLVILCSIGKVKSARKILLKILLPSCGSSFTRLESFLTIVLGGTAALHAYRVWGAVIFCPRTSGVFLLALAHDHALARLPPEQERPTPKVQLPMLNSKKTHLAAWPIALTLTALIIATTIIVIFLRLESWPARTARQSTVELERLGENLRSAFIDIAHLQPRITINNRVYMEETTPMSELVVLSRRIEVEHELLHIWVGSSKRVKLHGTFIAKAGFDLQEGLSINVRPGEISVQLPRAQILGVEQQQVDVLAFENGLWNRISGQDVESELSVLPQLAWKKAAETGLPAEAEQTLQRQLEDRIHTPQPLRLVFKDEKKNE
jgi:hypothetical protein